eukprot:CAMPEP_0204408178 /NCGR_PEP_ID=MMETSP0470-20130426/9263_1 /ASSEMBLY_ACC=CAM_ASM_000385 /TAXON_ID=2969 /ORGANISM="Oxyrrhis marina" /LENGTH=137 /DNA_ID=CAMNT_0051403901 /DNA_START=123 /DNA_END=536 /DNA_ORIENTATION=-
MPALTTQSAATLPSTILPPRNHVSFAAGLARRLGNSLRDSRLSVPASSLGNCVAVRFIVTILALLIVMTHTPRLKEKSARLAPVAVLHCAECRPVWDLRERRKRELMWNRLRTQADVQSPDLAAATLQSRAHARLRV